MTWFIDTGRFPVVATVDGATYSGGTMRRLPRFASTHRRPPLTDETKAALPKSVAANVRSDGYTQHILIDQIGYLLLSEPAVEVLSRFQRDGWEAVPIEATARPSSQSKLLAGKNYYLLYLFLRRDIVDLEKSNIAPTILNKGTIVEKTVWWLNEKLRKIAIKHNLIGDISIWLGDGAVLGHVYFISDSLKEAWCEMGMNPAVFEPCIDV